MKLNLMVLKVSRNEVEAALRGKTSLLLLAIHE